MDKTGWTLILWDIGERSSRMTVGAVHSRRFTKPSPAENVPIPSQLQDTNGIKALRKVLQQEFAESRDKQLYCIKFACWWPDYTSKYADLLGNLTLLADMEAVTYHWQGKPDKNHNADEMLMQVQKMLCASLA